MLTDQQHRQFAEDGYVVIENAVEPALFEPLRAASARVIERTRRGDWPHKRVIGDGDLWGISHLLHPELGEPVFAEYMASAPVLEVATDLLGPDLRLGLVNMLFNPTHADHAIGWHRDILRREMPPEQEVAELSRLKGSLQWNTALYDDDCLLIVPGSHLRAATPEEREILFQRPMEPLPQQLVVSLKPGQGVYYDNQLIHRGVYSHSSPRATLHAALTHSQAKGFCIHYEAVRWMEAPGFRESLPARLLPLYDNWLDLADECREAA